MPRPVGKYFASIITKIVALKRQENIVVDQNFKQMLRGDIVRHIALIPNSKIPARNFYQDFFRNNYSWTVVLSFLFITTIAVGLKNFKLPFLNQSFSPVVIPVVTTQISPVGNLNGAEPQSYQENSQDIQPLFQEQDSQKQEASSPSNSSSSKVLGEDVPQISNPTASALNSNPSAASSPDTSVAKIIGPQPSPVPIVQPVNPPIITPSPIVVATPPTSSPSIPPVQPPLSVAPTPNSASPSPTALTGPITTPSAPAPSDSPTPTASTPSPSALALPLSDTTTSPNTQSLQTSYPVVFQGTFTDQQKTSVQKDVLSSLLQDKKDVVKVQITSPNKDIITVELSFKGGTSSTYRYYFDYRTQKWTVIIKWVL